MFVETQDGPLLNLEHVLLLGVEPEGQKWALIATVLGPSGELVPLRICRGAHEECALRRTEILRGVASPGPRPAAVDRAALSKSPGRGPIHGIVRSRSSCRFCGVRAWVWVTTKSNQDARLVCIGCDHTETGEHVPLKVRCRAVDAVETDREG